MPDCVISSVDHDESFSRPIIANFQNGQLNADQVDKLQCLSFVNKTTKRKSVAVATKKMTYTAVDSSESDLCHTLLMIRNKETNKIRVVPVTNMSLNAILPRINTALESTLGLNKSTIADLSKQFGSKKAKRKTEQIERMRMNISNVEKELEQTVADIKINREDLVAPSTEGNEKFYRPPMNRDASTVETIYELKNIITQEELDTLNDLATEVLETNVDPEKLIPFVAENIKEFKNSKHPNKMQKIKILLYMDAILKFFKIPIRNIHRKGVPIDPYPETICSKVLQQFTVLTDNNRSRPISMRDKATCYCIVLGLILLDYKLNLEQLSKSLGVGVKKLLDVSRILGAQQMPNSRNTIVLKLPLPPQTTLLGPKRRK